MKASERTRGAMLEALGEAEFPVGEELPAEARLAERFGVSRLTVRETLGALASSGVLEVQQGRRNRVAPVEQWSVLEPDVVAARARLEGDTMHLVQDLMEARRVLEVGLVHLAARRISEADLQELEQQIGVMAGHLEGAEGVEPFARADIRFHEVILEAAHNPFLREGFQALAQILLKVRVETSRTSQVRHDALQWHQEILRALRAHDERAAVRAMTAHMDQTVEATQAISLV